MSIEIEEGPDLFPEVWRTGIREVPSRFAIWFPARQTYQIVITNRQHYPHLQFTNTLTDRTNPYYFACTDPDESSRNVSIVLPQSRSTPQITIGMWFTGGWLCRKTENQLYCTIPIMGVTDISKFSFLGNVGLHTNPAYYEWLSRQASIYTSPIILNRQESSEESKKKEAIPTFVAETLVKTAIEKGDCCPISMESFQLGKTTTVVTTCYHIFIKSSIDAWCDHNDSCPVCKQKMGTYTVV